MITKLINKLFWLLIFLVCHLSCTVFVKYEVSHALSYSIEEELFYLNVRVEKDSFNRKDYLRISGFSNPDYFPKLKSSIKKFHPSSLKVYPKFAIGDSLESKPTSEDFEFTSNNFRRDWKNNKTIFLRVEYSYDSLGHPKHVVKDFLLHRQKYRYFHPVMH